MGKVINFYKGLGKGRSQTQVRAQPLVVTPELGARSTAPAATSAAVMFFADLDLISLEYMAIIKRLWALAPYE